MRIMLMVGLGLMLAGGAASADVVCKSKTGTLALRTACKKKETLVPSAMVGGAVAWAHVKRDGTVDATNSRNITSANVVKLSTSAYCFHGLPFTVSTAIVTGDYADIENGSTVTTSFAAGDPYEDCIGQPGTQAEVATSVDSGFTPAGFYIVFY